MAVAGTAYVPFKPDLTQFQAEIRRAVGPATEQFKKLGSSASASAPGMKRAAAASKQLDETSRRLGSSLRTAGKYALSAAGAYIGLSQIKGAITATDDLAKTTIALHSNLGFATQSASELGAVLQVRGIDTQKASMAFTTLAGQVHAAATGSKTAAANFTALGISQKQLQKDSPTQTLFAVADGLKKLGPGFDRASIARSEFGRGAQALLPVLRGGSKALQEQLGWAKEYGASFTGKTIDGPKEMIKTQRQLQFAQLGLQVQFTKNLEPALIGAMKAFGNLLAAVKKASPILKIIGIAVGLVVVALVSLPAAIIGAAIALDVLYSKSKTFRTIVDEVATVIKEKAVVAFDALKVAGAAAFEWVKGAGQWLSRAAQNVSGFVTSLYPVKVVIAGLGIEFGLMKNMIIGLSPILSLIARLIGTEVGGAFKVAWALVKDFGQTFGNVVGIVSNLLRGNWGNAWKDAKSLVSDQIQTIISIVKTGFNTVKNLVTTVAKALGGAFSGAWTHIKGLFSDGVAAVQGFINLIVDAVNAVLPGSPLGHVGGGSGGSATQPTSRGNHKGTQGLFSGGKVMAPTAIVGEEAPRHPEYVVATNPAYRKRNLGLWASAGSELGVPGFAMGGRLDPATMNNMLRAGVPGHSLGSVAAGIAKDVGGVALNPTGTVLKGAKALKSLIQNLPSISSLPDWLKGLGSYALKGATDWAKGKIPGFAKGGIVKGKVSWFSGGTMASGRNTDSSPGIALNHAPGTDAGWSDALAHKWLKAQQKFNVSIKGHSATLPVLDLGPAGFTDRAIDVDAAGLKSLGFNAGNFPTDAIGTASILGGKAIKTGKGIGSAKAKSLGLGSLQGRINQVTSQSDIWADYAQRADTLGQAVFGFDQLHWLQQELGALMTLRNLLITALERLKASLKALQGQVKTATTSAVKGGDGASILDNFKNNAWVDAHTLDVTKYMDQKFGMTMSSGFRSVAHNAAIGGAPGSLHTHGNTANPGATDSVPPKTSALAWAKANIAGIKEAMIDNYAGLGSNLHLGFFAKGGKMGGSAASKKAAAAIKAQRQAYTQKISDTTSALTDLQGIGSSMKVGGNFNLGDLGGRILDVQQSIRDYGGGGSASGGAGLSIDDLQNIMALKGLGVSFTPGQFAGVFHTGGIVKGPYGQERTAIVKSGEGVFTPEQMEAMGGAQQPVWHFYLGDKEITDLVRVEREKHERSEGIAEMAGA